MLILYRLGIVLYGLLVKTASLFNNKAKQFISGRRNLFERLHAVNTSKGPVVWIHAASLGEFEQGRPIIESIKAERPDVKILLTFFSPSGYATRKNYDLADWVFYLPLDTPRNAKRFVKTVNPTLAVFVKYELWYYHLKALQEENVPVYMISAIFRKKQMFFKWPGRFFEPVLAGIGHYFVQDEISRALIGRIASPGQVTVTGDTRFDRVIDIASGAREFEIVEGFCRHSKVMVLGSTWPGDLKVVGPFLKKFGDRVKFIIAPHNIREEELKEIEQTFPGAVRYSKPKNLAEARVLIIDNIGMLSSLYGYGDFAFIGGGFRGALHNTLEAAVYGIPVFFGAHENNKKFAEAIALEKEGAAWSFQTDDELTGIFTRLIEDEAFYGVVSKKAGEFVKKGSGATKVIMDQILQII